MFKHECIVFCCAIALIAQTAHSAEQATPPERERALLERIRVLEERLSAVEARLGPSAAATSGSRDRRRCATGPQRHRGQLVASRVCLGYDIQCAC